MKLTKGEQNLLDKYRLDDNRALEPRTIEVSNPLGYGTALLNDFEFNLFSLIMEKYQDYLNGNHKAVKEYDALKYLFLKFNSSAYTTLID